MGNTTKETNILYVNFFLLKIEILIEEYVNTPVAGSPTAPGTQEIWIYDGHTDVPTEISMKMKFYVSKAAKTVEVS